jgi:G6PDH family F420-dependent oxidoreductase
MPDRREEKQSGRRVGYWAAHEQYSMHDLLKFVVEAEKCGFNATMASDHFHPWWHDNAFASFAWVWIAAAAARTNRMRFITGVTAPLDRSHPAVIVQAFASLDVLYPGRIGLGLGTGEAMNEVPLGFDWPKPSARLTRTVEALKIIRKLWGMPETPTNSGAENKEESGFVDFNVEYFLIQQAKLYTAPTYTYISSSGWTRVNSSSRQIL